MSVGMIAARECGNPTKNMPAVENVQQGYVVPSKLEIELQDLDRDGKNEVILNYDGTRYLFMLNEQGKPQVEKYTINVERE